MRKRLAVAALTVAALVTAPVPWASNRTKESANFILLWGDRFDPDSILRQLENLYSFSVNTMRFTPETGLLALHRHLTRPRLAPP